MARVYEAVGPSSNKAAGPGKEKKDGKRGQTPPAPPENVEKNDEGGVE